MTNRFDNQVAIVTGGASGIGKAIARRMAVEGARVVLFDLREEELIETANELQEEGLQASGTRVDITKELEVTKAVQRVLRDQGKIDVMVNSAGVVGPTSRLTVDYSFQDFQQVVNVNLGGAFLMTKYCLPPMLERNYGRVLLIASIGGKEIQDSYTIGLPVAAHTLRPGVHTISVVDSEGNEVFRARFSVR